MDPDLSVDEVEATTGIEPVYAVLQTARASASTGSYAAAASYVAPRRTGLQAVAKGHERVNRG